MDENENPSGGNCNLMNAGQIFIRRSIDVVYCIPEWFQTFI